MAYKSSLGSRITEDRFQGIAWWLKHSWNRLMDKALSMLGNVVTTFGLIMVPPGVVSNTDKCIQEMQKGVLPLGLS